MDRKRKWFFTTAIIAIIMCVFLMSSDYSLQVHSANVEEEQHEESEDVQRYELTYAKPDGSNGFYRTKPTVKIVNQDKRAVTKCVMKYEKTILKESTIEGEVASITINGEEFPEGITTIEIWMEQPIMQEDEIEETDQEEMEQEEVEQEEAEQKEIEVVWEEVEGTRKSISFQVDTMPVNVTVSAAEGFDRWYTDDVAISVSAKEAGISGLSYFTYTVNGSKKGTIHFEEQKKCSNYNGNIVVTESSIEGKPIMVDIRIGDCAGNETCITRTLLIDRKAPLIVWKGAADYQISAKPIELSVGIQEENKVASSQIHVLHHTIEKEDAEWDEENSTGLVLSQEGTYEVTAITSDQAGHQTTEVIHLTIDQTSPVIRYVDQLNGSYLPYFEWNYKSEEMVFDFLSYDYYMKVDGVLYHPGERIESEGLHMLFVEAVDAAGNKSEIQAGFTIDHTAPVILFGNVQDGKSYREAIDLNISTENKEDYIQKIEINRERQKVNTSSRYFQFPFQEPGNYEVIVSAIDLAGNKEEKSISFEIISQTTIKETLKKKGMIKSEGEYQNENVQQTLENNLNQTEIVIMLIVLFVITSVIVCQIYENLKKDNKKNLHKREDAK